MRQLIGTKNRRGNTSRFARVVGATLLFLAVAAATPASAAGNDRYRSHPGYVDGSPFVELANPRGQLVEVTLHGRLLNLISQRAIRRHDEELGAILEGLVSMQAVIASLRAQDEDEVSGSSVDRAKDMVSKLGAKLEKDGWDRFVRVREGNGEELFAFAHISIDGTKKKTDNERIDGLVVMGITGGSELLFVNVAGDIDMAAVAVLGERFDIPGLDDLPGDKEVREEHRKRRDERKTKSVARGADAPDDDPRHETPRERRIDR